MGRWALVVGSREARSGLVVALIEALEARGAPVAGVRQEAVMVDGARVGHRARQVGGPGEARLGRAGEAREGEVGFCGFAFEPSTFEAARRWLREGASAGAVLLIDEVSKLEVAGLGHHDAIGEALAGPCTVVLSVRQDQLFSVIERFSPGDPIATLEALDELPAFVEAIVGAR